MSEPDAQVQRAIDLQVRFYRLLRALGPDDPWLSLELTMPQLKVLLLLNAQGASRVGALAKALRVTLPTVTGVLDRLVEQGLVRRDDDPEDRRLVISHLTERGHEIVDRLQEANRARLARVFESLDTEDLAALVASMERLVGAAESLVADAHTTAAGAAR